MSRHEGVSCDSCLKSNFNGRRYKCLICFDYDLCADCYEEGATSTRHSVEHPMQCILTRSDIDLYFGGEMLSSEQPQSFTCPYCKKMGFSDATLLDHVGAEHTDTGLEVVCPVCAGLPGGDPNLVTDDFAGHLTLEHRSGHRDLISFLDEPSAIRHGGVRRIPGRTLGGPRSRRTNMHFSSSSGMSALSPSGRESVDPIAELLSQLSGVRRGAPQTTQLQQLQMQIQLERQQVSATRQQLERLPRRQAHPIVTSSNSNVPMQEVITGSGASVSGISASGLISSAGQQQQPQSSMAVSSLNSRDGSTINSSQLTVANLGISSTGFQTIAIQSAGGNTENQSQFLLAKFMNPTLNENQLEKLELDRADRSQYVQALMLSTLSSIKLDCENDDNQKRGESQETNSDNLNSETNNESNDETTTNTTTNTKEEKNSKSSSFGVGGGGGGGVNCQQRIQVHQQQQTSPEDFLDEYNLQQQQQQQQNYNSVCKKKLPIAGKSNQSSQQNSAATAVERRGRPPPPPIGSGGGVVGGGGVGGVGGVVGSGGGGGGAQGLHQQQSQQNQAKLGREMKAAAAAANAAAAKEIPDSR